MTERIDVHINVVVLRQYQRYTTSFISETELCISGIQNTITKAHRLISDF